MRTGTPRISQSLNLNPAADVVAVIHFDADACGFEFRENAVSNFHHFAFLIIIFEDGHDDSLNGREAGRQHKTLVVAVGHDDGADHAGGKTPRSCLAELQGVVLVNDIGSRKPSQSFDRSNVRWRIAMRFLSCIMPSMEVVICAPANLSVSLLVPLMTGMAASLMAKSA